MKYLLILILTVINVKSQLLLNIKSLDANANSKLIIMEISNPSDLTYSIPIDTLSFKPFSKSNNIDNFSPTIQIKHNNKSINYQKRVLELNETQIDDVNKGNKLIYKKSNNGIFTIKPKEKLLIPIKFNPLQFNIENGKYDSFDIIDNQDYIITVYLSCKFYSATDNKERIIPINDCIKNDCIKSNSIKVKWNLKNIKYIKW